MFDLADRAGVTLFGTAAKFIDAVAKSGLRPRDTHRLGTVRTITSTGSPLAPESFDFVYGSIKPDVHLASISGGTDIVSCFVGGNPNAPVWRGEIQAPALGMAVDVFDSHGRPLADEPGELVCTAPFPSMPVGFWNDPDGERYRAAYFDRFPGVWCHGDWIRATEHGGFIIYGRSDATLNPGGVRIGTAEIYRQVEQFPEIVESLAVGQAWDGDERIVLFVRLAPGAALDDALRKRIAQRLKTEASPRHVPARVIAVADIPRTKSGKIVELAVRDVIHGRPVRNREALANPEALDLFRDLPDLGVMTLTMHRASIRAVVLHARRARPREACGLLVGAGARVAFAVPIRNLARGRTRYRLDPAEHIALRRVLRAVTPAARDPGRLSLPPAGRGPAVGHGRGRGALSRLGASHRWAGRPDARRARVSDHPRPRSPRAAAQKMTRDT